MPDYKCLAALWWPCGHCEESVVRSLLPEVARCEGARCEGVERGCVSPFGRRVDFTADWQLKACPSRLNEGPLPGLNPHLLLFQDNHLLTHIHWSDTKVTLQHNRRIQTHTKTHTDQRLKKIRALETCTTKHRDTELSRDQAQGFGRDKCANTATLFHPSHRSFYSCSLSLEKLASAGRITQSGVVLESQSVRQHSQMHSNLHLSLLWKLTHMHHRKAATKLFVKKFEPVFCQRGEGLNDACLSWD